MQKPIPSQQEHDPNNPEEHFLWAMRQLPMFAGSGMVTHSGFLRRWSEHLWKAGFRHRDWLESLADTDGNIHTSRLPEQEIRFQEAFRGPHHTYNNAARWVGPDEPDPTPVTIPNIRDLTLQEQHALLYQFANAGMIPQPPHGPAVSEVME